MDSFGLYVHWPFCLAKCPYCDFNSHVRERVDEGRYARALVRELEHWAGRLGRRRLDTVFFGGGTPSLMGPSTVGAVLDRAAALFDVGPDLEVTLEANPTSVEAGRFAGFRAAGVNRVSLGVQALDDAALHALGREHNAGQALAALELAGRTFERWSFDLIYARPGQTAGAWARELRRAVELGSDHLSLYQLTIEPGTHFHARHARGQLVLPEEDAQAELYELTQELTAGAGLRAYEVSNHARPGQESRHNLVYWRYGDYAGIGPGAHGRVGLEGAKVATVTERLPERWLAAVEAAGSGVTEATAVTPADQAIELLMMGLRLDEGIDLDRLATVAGRPLAEVLDLPAMARLVEGGFLERGAPRLRASASGRRTLNGVLAALIR